MNTDYDSYCDSTTGGDSIPAGRVWKNTKPIGKQAIISWATWKRLYPHRSNVCLLVESGKPKPPPLSHKYACCYNQYKDRKKLNYCARAFSCPTWKRLTQVYEDGMIK